LTDFLVLLNAKTSTTSSVSKTPVKFPGSHHKLSVNTRFEEILLTSGTNTLQLDKHLRCTKCRSPFVDLRRWCWGRYIMNCYFCHPFQPSRPCWLTAAHCLSATRCGISQL